MARNQEKQRSELNRFVLAKENDQTKVVARPPLYKLHTAEAIRRWIPDLKREIRYCAQQIEGNRNYTEAKLREFRQKLDDLEKEYKQFVAKAIQLDANPMWLPGSDHSYISKSEFSSSKELREKGKEMVNFNKSEGNAHLPTAKKKTVPQFIQPILSLKTKSIQAQAQTQTQTQTEGDLQSSEDSSSDSSDEEIETPLAFTTEDRRPVHNEDIVASNNRSKLNVPFNSSCVKYYMRK